jgi:hypothetical protein
MAKRKKIIGIIYIDGVLEEFTGHYFDYAGRNISREFSEGPAICLADSREEYWVDGKLVLSINEAGDRYWYKDGEYHRLDGPAVEWTNGRKEWWLDGKQYSEWAWEAKLSAEI